MQKAETRQLPERRPSIGFVSPLPELFQIKQAAYLSFSCTASGFTSFYVTDIINEL